MLFKAFFHCIDGFTLVLTGFVLFLELDVLDIAEAELTPVDRAVGQVFEEQAAYRDGLCFEGFICLG